MAVRILFIGDVVGRPGRRMVGKLVPALRRQYDFIIVNGENAAGGMGLTAEIANQFLEDGVDVITGGNHTFRNRDIFSILDKEDRVIRPLNYPDDSRVPGRGLCVVKSKGGAKLGVVNLMGRVFMKAIDCPFRAGLAAVEKLRAETPLVLVDMHAEATSEKRALAYFLDGRATAVIGTHTHVATADEEILAGGLAFITDVGMTGPHDSIIGVKTDIILENFLTGMPVRHQVATGDVRLSAVVIEADEETGKALQIDRIQIKE